MYSLFKINKLEIRRERDSSRQWSNIATGIIKIYILYRGADPRNNQSSKTIIEYLFSQNDPSMCCSLKMAHGIQKSK